MKIFFLTNNDVTYPLLEWLRSKNDTTVKIYERSISTNDITNEKPDLLISYNYKHIIHKEVLQCAYNRIINLHISYLPWNKGAYPNVWSFLTNSPHGITIHFIDEGIDTGNILWQSKIEFIEEEETLSSTYVKLHQTIQELFRSKWKQIKNFTFKPIPQQGKGSLHYINDFNRIKSILGNEGWDISIPVLKERYEKYKSSNAQ